jgi:hypothetical protein
MRNRMTPEQRSLRARIASRESWGPNGRCVRPHRPRPQGVPRPVREAGRPGRRAAPGRASPPGRARPQGLLRPAGTQVGPSPTSAGSPMTDAAPSRPSHLIPTLRIRHRLNVGSPVNTSEIPWTVFKHLRAGFVSRWAHWQLQTLANSGGYEPGGLVHPGDPFGTVLAWIWEEDPEEADDLACSWHDLCARRRVGRSGAHAYGSR